MEGSQPAVDPRRLRILLVILQFPPDVNSTGTLFAQLCDGLAALGHKISVITTFPHYQQFRIWEEYRGKLAAREPYHDLDVLRLWVYASGAKQRMVHRLLSYLSFNALATVASVARSEEYDVVLCTNGGFFAGVTAWIHRLFRGTPFIYNVQDLYPETPVAAGQLTSPVAINGLARIERFMYQRATRISVITPSFRENLLTKGVPAEKVAVIPNFVDTEFIRPLPKANEFALRQLLADRFVVTHAGNVGYVYDLDTLIDAAALLRDERDITVLIVGDGVARGSLEERARGLGLDNVRFLPFQPYEDLPSLRATSDVQVSLYKPHSGRYSMPSKIYEIMASGRPVLASADHDTDVRKVIDEIGCGICVEPGSPEALANAIRRLHDDPAGRAAMGERGRAAAERTYSIQAAVAAYDLLLQAVASGVSSFGYRAPLQDPSLTSGKEH